MNHVNKTLNEALYEAVSQDDVAAVRILLDYGASPDAPCVSGHTVLFHSVRKDPAIAEVLLERGASVDARGRGDYTALSWAIFADKSAVVDLLLKHGADIETRDEYGRTALLIAACEGRAELVEKLISRGAKLEAKSFMGSSAEDLAKDHPDVLKTLEAARLRAEEERRQRAFRAAQERREMVEGRQKTLKQRASGIKPGRKGGP